MTLRRWTTVIASTLAGLMLLAAPVAGDTTGPQITIIAPQTGTIYDQILHIEAAATDADGIELITFKADGREIKSFVSGLASGRAVSLDWRRARDLTPGEHTITVEARDQSANPATGRENKAQASVTVRRVTAASLPKARTTLALTLGGSGLSRTVSGRVSAPSVSFPREAYPLAGRVRITWEVFSYGRWKVRHKGAADARAPFRVGQHLAQKGRWRVHAVYEPQAPYAASRSKTITFASG